MAPIGVGKIKVNRIETDVLWKDSDINLDYFELLLIFADDGEGHIGTVCELGRHGSTYSPEKTVVVNWDSGNRSNYRVGYQDQFDLIIVDNAQIGRNRMRIERKFQMLS